MKTNNYDTFDMYIAALREGIENPVQFAVSKTGEQMTFAAMTADNLVLEADGGFYIAIEGMALPPGALYTVGFDNYELVELCQEQAGVAVWYAEIAQSAEAPAIFSIPELVNG